MSDVLPWEGALWGPGGARQSVRTFVRRHPFTLLYVVVAWGLFLPLVGPDGSIPDSVVRTVAYRPRAFVDDPLLALRQSLTAPWFHRNLVHLSYITIFFLAIAVPFEAHEGTRRAAALFVVASLAAAAAAGAVLLALQSVSDAGWIRASREWGWIGGSAGTFGLFGASIRRSRRPLVLLACILAYEAANEILYLQNFTPVFHVCALGAGWAVAGRLLADRPARAA